MNIAKRAINIFLLLMVLVFAIGIVESIQDKRFDDDLVISLCGFALIAAVNYVFFGKVALWNKTVGLAANDGS